MTPGKLGLPSCRPLLVSRSHAAPAPPCLTSHVSTPSALSSLEPHASQYTRLEHHVVVVAPCSMGGAGSDVAVALPGSDAIKSFWTPQGDAVTVVTASELAAGLRGTDAWRVLK